MLDQEAEVSGARFMAAASLAGVPWKESQRLGRQVGALRECWEDYKDPPRLRLSLALMAGLLGVFPVGWRVTLSPAGLPVATGCDGMLVVDAFGELRLCPPGSWSAVVFSSAPNPSHIPWVCAVMSEIGRLCRGAADLGGEDRARLMAVLEWLFGREAVRG